MIAYTSADEFDVRYAVVFDAYVYFSCAYSARLVSESHGIVLLLLIVGLLFYKIFVDQFVYDRGFVLPVLVYPLCGDTAWNIQFQLEERLLLRRRQYLQYDRIRSVVVFEIIGKIFLSFTIVDTVL